MWVWTMWAKAVRTRTIWTMWTKTVWAMWTKAMRTRTIRTVWTKTVWAKTWWVTTRAKAFWARI
jgi:hypothetical protein